MTNGARWAGLPALIAVIFLAFHLPYFPKSLEDLDSINFALGVRHFDIAQHQPHPPGYPVYILAGKAAHAIIHSEPSALAVLSMLAGACGILAIAALFRRLRDDFGARWTLAAVLLAVTSPLYWFTAARPLSDMVGLAAAAAVQAMTLAAVTPRMVYAASFAAGLASGVRSQVAWLTVPLLLLVAFRGPKRAARQLYDDVAPPFQPDDVARPFQGRGGTEMAQIPDNRVGLIIGVGVAFIAGALVWAIPLLILSGGPAAYWRALTFQGSADLGNIQMLWTRHGVRDIADALYFAFVAPWVTWPIASVVLLFALIGSIAVLLQSARTLLLLGAAFGPYLIFDVLFQETFTSRYALPLVIPIAFLAAAGMRMLPWQSGAIVAITVAMLDAHTGGTSVAAYARERAPAFHLLDAMAEGARNTPQPPVLAMDRKQSFDFRRPLVWADGAVPAFERTLPAPPQHEWLEAVKDRTRGGRSPVWFVVDPKRAAIDLVQHGDPSKYRWPLPYPVLVGGARPDEMDWYRVDRPEWFVGEGWALTPEAAGVAEADHRDLARSPIDAWVSGDAIGGVLMIGGRNFEPAAEARLSLSVGAEMPTESSLGPGPFLRFLPLRSAQRIAALDYAKVSVGVSPPVRIAIEQFDASFKRTLFGFGSGWHEQELNPASGARWRWLSERGELRFGSPTPRLTLHIEGESPRVYFSRGSHLVMKAGDRVVFDDVLTSDFALDIPIPTGTETVSLETDQVFQPADRSRKSADHRHLGLRIFKCAIRPVS